MPENVHDVAAYIVARLGAMETYRFQKLVYYSQAWHLALQGSVLFPNEVQAWVDGPVVRALYEQHRRRTSVSSWPSGDPRRLQPASKQHVDWVLATYGSFSGDELSRMTHAEAPWRLARGGIPDDYSSDAAIDNKMMMDYYSRLRMSPDEAVTAAVGSARLEGHEFSDDAQDRMRQVAWGVRSADDAVAEILARRRRSDVNS
ncbi:type II toxin-antitoxin system antitoxin SocA domain-containing protein [Parafrankia sp. EUN1f]|uniref:type II toxin-antitoxin system antitoxin SocA domain-containing protein n=1 Tax=Parafrankia sp. EUN1f TaxID=102897 RepID=UPI0001C456A7|nr:type II toxin-antitoxin system antitoxin SocA domain-containing protein [Parafrankia sp. EUN1f]EFC78872.1 Uncharacterized phage-associated protein-like protein [Parafrankia sp. EUN1f]